MMQKFGYLSHFAIALALGITLTATVPAVNAQDSAKPKVSDGETKAVTAISSAADAAAKLTAAEAFVKKYPKSTLRPEVAKTISNEIGSVKDAAQRLPLAERFLKTFTAEGESDRIRVLVIDDYARAKRGDDAFALGATALAKQPDNVAILTILGLVGAEEVRQQNPKHGPISLQYGLKAIELIEANKKPANMDDETWTYQKTLLPRLYLDMGMLSLASNKPADARPRLEKAIQLDPTEPSGYVYLGGIVDDEYKAAAEAYKGIPEGPDKQAALKKATDLMDKVIDLYAHALGTASGRPEYKPMYDQILESITPYYRYRYKSTTGLQALIDKYKVPAKTTP
jgi:tetratricopeptide (TPR) repeat protein